MKTVQINLYSFNELSEKAKQKAILDAIEFEIEFVADENSRFKEVFEEMERMQTPWFAAETIYHTPKYKQMIIDNLLANDYTFEADGTMNNG